MDVQMRLDDIVAAVEGARSMPMSASCVINRTELLEMLEEVRQALPGSLAQAQELIGGREQLVEQARQEAERIVEQAHSQRGELLSQTEMARRAQEEAERIVAEARQEAAGIRADADDYVDSKLANFEVVLSKTVGSVDRGRAKLLGHDPGFDDVEGFDEAPERSADPMEQRRRADDYIEAQFRAFENVLTKTLEAVGRGRQKLEGRVKPIDDLAAHIAGQEEGPAIPHQMSDDGYLADLAATQQRPHQAAAPEQGAIPDQIPVPEQPQYYGQQPAGYGGQQGGYDQQTGGYDQQTAGYDQQYQDPYGVQQPQYADASAASAQQQGYGHGQQDAYWQQHQPQGGHDAQGGWQHTGQTAALDETSLFDTGMIDLEQLRQYDDQGR
ncbi:ATP synthase F0 subunit B [Streptomyces sp. NPDC051940]|uniref:ATP synthase F0 subunit B n=1 Tax=Streptomyces sp. NPDC051940 TaxID=3155675 RepID=UPI00343C9457